MSVQSELDRLKNLSRDSNVSEEQRQKARAARDRINVNMILAAWARIEARTAEYEALVKRLAAVVDDIAADRLTTAIDDVTEILSDVTAAAGGPAGAGETG